MNGSNTFKDWFGASKVVNSDGTPKVVYHGTPNGGFSTFSDEMKGKRTGHVPADVGFHFSDDLNIAETYSLGYLLESIEAYRRIFGQEPAATHMPPGASIYPVYLSLENPMSVPASRMIDAALIEEAKAQGHDGLIADLGGNAKEYVAFEAAQIKSAIGNRETFDQRDVDFCTCTAMAPSLRERQRG